MLFSVASHQCVCLVQYTTWGINSALISSFMAYFDPHFAKLLLFTETPIATCNGTQFP